MIDDIEIHCGTREETKAKVLSFAEQFEEAGYAWRGMDTTREQGGERYLLYVWTRGPWLIRIKEFSYRCEVAAFDADGYLCQLSEALIKGR